MHQPFFKYLEHTYQLVNIGNNTMPMRGDCPRVVSKLDTQQFGVANFNQIIVWLSSTNCFV